MNNLKVAESEFDKVSSNYENLLKSGLSLSGENSSFFAEKRIEHIVSLIPRLNLKHKVIMDFGCGTGGSVSYLLEAFNPTSLTVVDTSEESLRILKARYKTEQVISTSPSALKTNANHVVCFCNGVFHHILPNDRQNAAKIIYDSLKPRGYFCFWENNPWNPATHWVMSRIPFDHNAQKIFPHQGLKLLRNVGFKVQLTHYLFIFPRSLSFLRPIEKVLRRFPLGCQYLIIAQKP